MTETHDTVPQPDADAMRAWASGVLPYMAAVDIIVGTTLGEQIVLGGYIDPDGRPRPDLMLADDDTGALPGLGLSDSGRVLAQVTWSLLASDGVPVALGDLWRLDSRNRAAVTDAFTRHLQPGLADR